MTAPALPATVTIQAPASIDLGVVPDSASLLIATQVVTQFGYTVQLTVVDGVMMATAIAPAAT